MPSAPMPSNEEARLKSLEASGLLGSPPDAALGEIVRQAADLFGTPMSAVTLLDRSEQHFKASVGIDVPHLPRDLGFCGYTVLAVEPLVVLDMQADTRFADNPLVCNHPNLRFYAGVPIFGADGSAYGALCVIDTEARQAIDPALVVSLCALADDITCRFARLGVLEDA